MEKKMTEAPSYKIPRYVIGDFKGLHLIEGLVWRGKLQDFGEIALKQFVYKDKFKKEIDFLIEHRHPNIVHLYGILWDGVDVSRYLGYVMEYIEDGSLHDVIHKSTRSYDSLQIYKWVDQIARGLQFLHRNGIIHGDIKPANILVSGNHLKLADFGIAKDIETSTTAEVGTLRYMAPEVFVEKCYPSSDTYSLGIVIWEIFHRRQPYYEWENLSILALIEKINSGARPAIESGKMNGDVVMLILRCWQGKAEKRPEIKEVIQFFEMKIEFYSEKDKLKKMEEESAERLRRLKLLGPLTSDEEELLEAIKKKVSSEHYTRLLDLIRQKKEEGPSTSSSNSPLRVQLESLSTDVMEAQSSSTVSIPRLPEPVIFEKKALSRKMRSLTMDPGGDEAKFEIATDYETSSSELDRKCKHLHENTILLLGGMRNHYNEYAGLTILNCDRTKWTESLLELPYEARGSGAVYLDEEIYLFGGYNNPKALYKLDKNLKWIQLADMNIGRRWITNSCLVWNGCIWVFGGKEDDFEKLKSVEKYNPKENQWTLMPEMNQPRSGAAAALWKDNVIVCGGFSDCGRTDSVEHFNLKNNYWEKKDTIFNMPARLSDHSLLSNRRRLIAIGGHNGEISREVWEIDPFEISCKNEWLKYFDQNPIWKSHPPKKFPASHFGGIILDDEIYAIGGCQEQCQPHDRVEIFNGQSWRNGPRLPYKGGYMSAVIIPQILGNRLGAYKP